MQKDAYYFPHFCNARHDRKIKRLRKELGLEGYGIYFMLLETLREQQDLMYPIEDIDLLAEEFGTSEQKIRVVICNYELFQLDIEQKFFSPKMLIYLEPYFKMKNQRREAGLKSAAQRVINDRSTTVEQPFNKVKESKEKESKEKNTKESETFEIFWNKYDKKVDRSKAEIAWSKLKESEIEKILESVDKYVLANPDIQYRKNPLTYLNGKCFNDELINLKVQNNLTPLNHKPIIPIEWQ
jgi:hypothetical protein